jgi:peptidoglycan/xylan/chitin deacetylase (PgdA/CDA1 family)
MKKLSITFSLDDGSVHDYNLLKVLEKYEIEATLYLPAHWITYLGSKGIEPMTTSQAQEIAERFVIGSHGVDHLLLTRIDPALQDKEIVDSRKILQAMFDQPINSFCYPRGYYDQQILQKVKAAGYKSARTVKVGSLLKNTKPFEKITTAHIGFDRAEYGTDWLTYAQAKLARGLYMADDNVIQLHFWGHGEEIYRRGEWDRVVHFIKTVAPYAHA